MGYNKTPWTVDIWALWKATSDHGSMAQIGRASGARPGPVEVLCASGQGPSAMADASFMVRDHLVQGPQMVLRVSWLPRPHMGNLPRRSELLLGALPSKEDRCGLSWLNSRIGLRTMVIWPRTGETNLNNQFIPTMFICSPPLRGDELNKWTNMQWTRAEQAYLIDIKWLIFGCSFWRTRVNIKMVFLADKLCRFLVQGSFA